MTWAGHVATLAVRGHGQHRQALAALRDGHEPRAVGRPAQIDDAAAGVLVADGELRGPGAPALELGTSASAPAKASAPRAAAIAATVRAVAGRAHPPDATRSRGLMRLPCGTARPRSRFQGPGRTPRHEPPPSHPPSSSSHGAEMPRLGSARGRWTTPRPRRPWPGDRARLPAGRHRARLRQRERRRPGPAGERRAARGAVRHAKLNAQWHGVGGAGRLRDERREARRRLHRPVADPLAEPAAGPVRRRLSGPGRAAEDGRVRAIGLSNFKPEHVERVIDETGAVPDVNQIELGPTTPREPRAYHGEHGIVTESWSPLGKGGELLRATGRSREIAERARADAGADRAALARPARASPMPKSADPARMPRTWPSSTSSSTGGEVAIRSSTAARARHRLEQLRPLSLLPPAGLAGQPRSAADDLASRSPSPAGDARARA